MIPPHRVISFFSNATISTLFHPHQEIKNEHRAECMYFFIKIACEFLCRGTLLKRAAGESHQPQPRQGVGVGGAASAATRGPSHLPASGFCPNCPRGVGQAPPDLPGKQPAPPTSQASSDSSGGWRKQAQCPSPGTGRARAGRAVDTSTHQTETQNRAQRPSDTHRQSQGGGGRAGSGWEGHSLDFTHQNTEIERRELAKIRTN